MAGTPLLSRAQLGVVFKDQRTLLAFDAFQQQVASDLPSGIVGLQSLNFALTAADTINAPNGHVVTAGTGLSISASPGTVTYSVTSAPKWTSPRTLSFTGDASGTLAAVDGTANVSGTLTLAIVNGSPGTYALAAVTVDNKGRVTAASAASTTGSGSVAQATSPSLTTPSITGAVSLLGTVGAATNFDASGMTALTVPASSNAVIYPGATSYVLLTIAETAITGSAAIWLLAGTVATLVSPSGTWVASTTTPPGNSFSIQSTGGAFRIYAGTSTGGAFSFKSATLKIG